MPDATAQLAASLHLSADTRAVARAMALHWTWCTRTATHKLLTVLGVRAANGKPFGAEAVRVAQRELMQAGLLVEQPGRPGYCRLHDRARAPLYRQLLADTPLAHLRDALQRAASFDPRTAAYSWPAWEVSVTVALVRLEGLAGAPAKALGELRSRVATIHDWPTVAQAAWLEAFDAETFERITPEWRWDLAYHAAGAVCTVWRADLMPVYRWALAKLDSARASMPPHLRLQLAEGLLHQGEGERVTALLAGDDSGAADAVRAALAVQEGRFDAAQTGFEVAFKKLQGERNARKRLLPRSLAWYYPLALIAQHTPKHLEAARKFCAGEAGSRNPPPIDWGLWVHVLSVRLGDASLDVRAFELDWHVGGHATYSDLWRYLLHAWLGAAAVGRARSEKAGAKAGGMSAAVHAALRACGFRWLEAQLDAAQAVLAGGEAPEGGFLAGGREPWRAVLASLQALGGEGAGGSESAARVLWSIRIDRRGAVEAIEPLEQKRGARGWGRPKAVPLARLAKDARLEPWDAKVARAIRSERSHAGRCWLDRAVAIGALIGHPGVVLAEAPETLVDVVEGVPELEVLQQGGHYVMRITPPPRTEEEPEFYDFDTGRETERQALRQVTVLRESSQRVRVIRLTPAQQRAAKLVAGRFSVPASAQAELRDALQALAGHFQVQSDHAQAAREIAAESRLRAELAPAGDGLVLRLVAAPLGPDGPRLRPGAGRARVMAAVRGEALGAQRDLAAEQAHLDAVLAALDFLAPPARGDLVCEWVVADTDQALAMVEALPRLPAIESIDWPRGQPVRVITVDASRLALTVRSERDWFKLSGGARLDEGLVLELEALLAAAGGSGRFVPMGQGVYAALAQELREKLTELAAVTEARDGEMAVPHLAAAWLDEVLEGLPAQCDAQYAHRLEQLRAAQQVQPALPAGLQAELRTYQEDGYAWIMHLAQAGFGACLADDMGLGKTIQALAVLQARAAGGPALVVAPTSVCGNWLAETRRFAPALSPAIYGEGERDALIEAAGPRDVVIVSYTLMQQAQEAFAARSWHTLVADEAQAVKNAAAKRSLALFDLRADLRIALSGTPIENRLAELWSIMRFCNPGLLGTWSRFNERFAAPIERHRDRDAQRVLRRLIAPFVLRRTKSQVLQELPERTELIVTIASEPAQAAHYEALRRTAVAAAQSAVADARGGQAQMHILAQLTRLRRAACDPRLVNPELGLVGAKVNAFAELAADLVANRHKALVFSQFVDFLTLLRAPLDAAGLRYQYLDGATPADERTRRVAAFQSGEGDLFLISLKAGGFGLNLTAADYVIIADPWWNPAAEDQAMGRAHRIGQLRPVTVYRLVSKGTLEERIVELHHDKRALAEGVLSENPALAALPSSAELIALMRGA